MCARVVCTDGPSVAEVTGEDEIGVDLRVGVERELRAIGITKSQCDRAIRIVVIGDGEDLGGVHQDPDISDEC